MATKRIEGRAKTIRELLQGARFSIDFYQREYAWKERQVRELIEDLTAKFLDFHSPSDERADVEGYGHYFLGSIVISHKQQKRYIVDGQQRLTTLTLLLIHLHHLQAEVQGAVDVRDLIFSEKYGRRSFNIEVPERAACMDSLFRGESFDADDAIASVQNLVARYRDVEEFMPDEVKGEALPYFVDWLLENVHLVEIEAYSDEDAYTIFETMNDRGLSLSLPEMLKGYILANIRDEADQRRVNDLWKSHMQRLKEHDGERDVDFFKAWLRGRHAETIRPGNKGAENKDFERIGSEFHRWVRDQRQRLGLTSSEAFVRFVERDLDFYAKLYLRLLDAANALTPGLESVRFNETRGFSAQFQVLFASVTPDDAPEVVEKKIRLVADYLDIWLARRVWNYRTIAQSSTRYGVFTLCRDIRSLSEAELAG